MITLLAFMLAAQDTLQPIVITATRSTAPVWSVANAVTILDGETLRRSGITTVADALRGVPGSALAQAGSYGAQTSLFLRGGESDYVRVLLDGIPVNQAGGFIDLAHLSTDNIERIEVVRGPTSVLHGTDAVTGVVQIITRRGGRRSSYAVGARAGTFGTTQLGVEAAGAGRGLARLEGSAGLQHAASDGIYDFNNRYGRSAASVRIGWVGSGSDVAVTARGNVSSFRYPTNGSGAVVDSNQIQRSRSVAIALDAGRRLTDRLEMRLLAGVHAQRDSVDDRQDHGGDTLDFAYVYGSHAATGRRSADMRALFTPARAWRLTLGGAVDREDETSRNAWQGAFGPGGGATEASRTNRAVYTQVEAAGRVSLQAGARVDDNQRFGAFSTWRAGASVEILPGTRLRVAAGTAFKEPTFAEHYSTGFSVGNPDLKPERSRSWEVGVEYLLVGRRLTLAAGYFDQRFRDLIQYTFVPPPGDSANYYNIGAATSRGAELEARLRARDGITMSVQYTWLRTTATDSGFDGAVFANGERLLRRPTHSGSVAVRWQARPALHLGARAVYVGERDDVDFSTFPGTRVGLAEYGRLDVDADVTVWTRGGRSAAINLRVDNATDARYHEVFGFATPGRRLLAGVRVAGEGATR